MTTEKKKLQLEAVRNFWKALEDLRVGRRIDSGGYGGLFTA
jgi:hypothetical protein